MSRRFMSVIVGLALTAGIRLSAAQGDVDNEAGSSAVRPDGPKERLTSLEGKVTGLEESFLETKGVVDKLKKLKISGYVQAQFQWADTQGVQTSKAGSTFDKGSDSKFLVRRGRLKFLYDNGLSQYVMQFDGSTAGFEIKDAYLSITEPWLKYISGTMGIFDRPFGYEISYSSSMRETPERSRVYQTLFPKEREIGAKLAFSAEKGIPSFFNAKVGVFNGLTPLQLENDLIKDVIGRVGFEIPLRNIGMALDGGFSFYAGGVTNTDTTSMGTKSWKSIDSSAWVTKVTGRDSTGKAIITASKKYDTLGVSYPQHGAAYEMDGSSFRKLIDQKGKEFDRNYLGIDLQYYYDIPVIGGLTFRGEYLWGTQPGTSGSSSFYQPTAGQSPNGAVYMRNFNGYYFYWVQCWGSKVQTVVKYDGYDPNTDVGGNGVGAPGSLTTATDLKYKTYSFGLIYNWDENVKFMVNYDMPKNEKSTNLKNTDPYKDFSRDMPDNVFTFRIQYKF